MKKNRKTGVVKAAAPHGESERLVLSEAQFARFIEILEDPSPPTPSLVRALQRFQETKIAHPDRGL